MRAGVELIFASAIGGILRFSRTFRIANAAPTDNPTTRASEKPKQQKIRRASGPRCVRSFATSFTHTPTHPHPHTHTQRSAFTAYLFRKKGAALGGIWAVNTILTLPSIRRRTPEFRFSRSKKKCHVLERLLALQIPSKPFQNDPQNL